MVRFLISLFLVCLPIYLIGESDIDHSKDLDEIKKSIEEIKKIERTDPATALSLARKTENLASEKGYISQSAELLHITGSILRKSGRYSDANEKFEQSLKVWESLGNDIMKAKILSDIGFNLFSQNKNVEAIKKFQEALTVWEPLSDSGFIRTHFMLTDFYRIRNEYEKAFEHFSAAKSKINENSPIELKAIAYAVEGSLKRYERKYSEGAEAYKQSLKYHQLSGNRALEATTYNNLGYLYMYWAQAENSQTLYKESLVHHSKYRALCEELGIRRGELDYLINIAGVYRRMGTPQLALENLYKARKLAIELDSKDRLGITYKILSESYRDLGIADSTLYYAEKRRTTQSSILNEKNQSAIRFAEEYYETEKKEREIKEQQQQIQMSLIIGTLASLLLGSIGLFYFNRNRSQKKLMAQQQEINRQIVVDLVKEQTIENLNSRLEGQEQERERIARELHDRLGGTLSAVKLSLEGMENKLSPEAKDQYESTHNLLNMAANETRQLSHDMMALPLKHMGFEASVRELCNTLNKSGKLKAQFNTIPGQSANLSQKAERHLYRIVQELIQNVIKHAEASQVFIQLTPMDESTTLMVEDNGKGFDSENGKAGMGLSNIEARVEQLNGSFDIDSQPGRGTTVILDIPHQSD